MQVSELMATGVVTVDRNDDLRLVDDIMAERRIRHIPVVENGVVVGLVSQRDVFKARMSPTAGYDEKNQRMFLHAIPVEDVMAHPVMTVAPNTPVSEAIDLMIEQGIGCLPVVRDGQLIGIVTKTNLLQRLRALSATENEHEWSLDKTRFAKGLANVIPY